MIAVLEYGLEVGLLKKEESARLIRLILSVGKLPSINGISFEAFWKALAHDKKFLKGDIRMVLLRNLGEAAIYNGIETESLRTFLKRFLSGSRAFA